MQFKKERDKPKITSLRHRILRQSLTIPNQKLPLEDAQPALPLDLAGGHSGSDSHRAKSSQMPRELMCQGSSLPIGVEPNHDGARWSRIDWKVWLNLIKAMQLLAPIAACHCCLLNFILLIGFEEILGALWNKMFLFLVETCLVSSILKMTSIRGPHNLIHTEGPLKSEHFSAAEVTFFDHPFHKTHYRLPTTPPSPNWKQPLLIHSPKSQCTLCRSSGWIV